MEIQKYKHISKYKHEENMMGQAVLSVGLKQQVLSLFVQPFIPSSISATSSSATDHDDLDDLLPLR